jgi:hypothetical protein
MNLEHGLSEVVLAEIHTPAPEQEWQLLSAFLGFIDRHFGNRRMASLMATTPGISNPP